MAFRASRRWVVTGATYGVANELLGFSGTAWESRLYNSLFQVTSITSSSGINMQYTYPMDGTNIGKISTQKNVASPTTAKRCNIRMIHWGE